MNWNSYAPKAWKIATLKSLIKRAYMISSTDDSLNEELRHLKDVFSCINQYPKSVIDNAIAMERELDKRRKETKKTMKIIEVTNPLKKPKKNMKKVEITNLAAK